MYLWRLPYCNADLKTTAKAEAHATVRQPPYRFRPHSRPHCRLDLPLYFNQKIGKFGLENDQKLSDLPLENSHV